MRIGNDPDARLEKNLDGTFRIVAGWFIADNIKGMYELVQVLDEAVKLRAFTCETSVRLMSEFVKFDLTEKGLEPKKSISFGFTMDALLSGPKNPVQEGKAQIPAQNFFPNSVYRSLN